VGRPEGKRPLGRPGDRWEDNIKMDIPRNSQKFVDSIPAGVSRFFIDIKPFRSHYGPGVDSTSNRNENQEHFLGVKTAGA